MCIRDRTDAQTRLSQYFAPPTAGDKLFTDLYQVSCEYRRYIHAFSVLSYALCSTVGLKVLAIRSIHISLNTVKDFTPKLIQFMPILSDFPVHNSKCFAASPPYLFSSNKFDFPTSLYLIRPRSNMTSYS